ncbi:hypothetical protein FRC16_006390 [Serendipita sp. 398]|nr:hypothetical protein FRC16_006390 [Serendipita sp. 398]
MIWKYLLNSWKHPKYATFGSSIVRSSTFSTYRRLSTAFSTSTPKPLSELYYHLVKSPESYHYWSKNIFAISFLPKPPTDVEGSKTFIGVIPAIEAQEGAQEPGLNDFKANDKFLNLMHDTIQRALRDGADEAIQAEATQRGSGWLHIHDERNVPALGRIGDPDDIVASVMVENGKILSETYQRMPSYRLFTADGPPKLSPGLAHKLEEALLEEHRREGGE